MKNKHESPQTVFLKILIFGVIFSILHTLLERSLSYAASDVALMSLVRPINLGIILCDAASFFICYALLLLSFFCFGARSSVSSCLLLTAITLFKHLGNWAVFLISENVTSAIDIRLSALAAGSSVFIELLQHGLIVLGLCLVVRHGKTAKFATLWVCGVLLGINLCSRIIADIDYGAPSSAAEIWIMIAYYLFDILLYGIIAYIVLWQIYQKEKKKCIPASN